MSEREAGRRCGISTRLWNYYLKQNRREIIPLRVLTRLAEGLRMSPEQFEELQTAALQDAGWRVRVIRDEPDFFQVALEPVDEGDDRPQSR